MVQLDGQKHEHGDLWLNKKLDTANLGLKLCSHGGALDKTKLSFGLWIGRTTVLECLGSN